MRTTGTQHHLDSKTSPVRFLFGTPGRDSGRSATERTTAKMNHTPRRQGNTESHDDGIPPTANFSGVYRWLFKATIQRLLSDALSAHSVTKILATGDRERLQMRFLKPGRVCSALRADRTCDPARTSAWTLPATPTLTCQRRDRACALSTRICVHEPVSLGEEFSTDV